MNGKKLVFNVFSYLLSGAVMVFAIRMIMGDNVSRVAALLAEINLQSVLLLTMCALIFNFFDSCAIYLVAKQYKEDFTFAEGLLSGFFAAIFRALTFGMGTGAALIYFLNKRKIHPEFGYGIATVTYSFHKIAVAIHVTIAMVLNYDFFRTNYGEYFNFIFIGYGATIVIIGMLLAVCISRKTHKLILWVLRGVFKSPKFLSYINLVAARLNGLETETKKVLKDKSIAIKLLIVQFMKISGWYLIPYFGFKAVAPSLEISLFTCFSIMALIVAIVGVIPLPGNAASTELLFSYMYSGMVEEATSVAGLVIYRATTYYVSFVIGAVIIISWLVGRKIKEKREKVH